MPLSYSFKIESHEGKGFYAALGATDDPAPDAQMKSFAGWRWFPWNGGTAPTEAELKSAFTAPKQDDKGSDIAGSSIKDALDAQLGVAPVVVSDVSEMVTVKNAKDEDVERPKRVSGL